MNQHTDTCTVGDIQIDKERYKIYLDTHTYRQAYSDRYETYAYTIYYSASVCVAATEEHEM